MSSVYFMLKESYLFRNFHFSLFNFVAWSKFPYQKNYNIWRKDLRQ